MYNLENNLTSLSNNFRGNQAMSVRELDKPRKPSTSMPDLKDTPTMTKHKLTKTYRPRLTIAKAQTMPP